MKNYLILASAALVFTSCSTNKPTTSNSEKTDSVTTTSQDTTSKQSLIAKMEMKSAYKVGDSVHLKFTVYNPSDNAMKFCKWHTPFEPLMSKYLDVKDASGEEAAYQGPMAKRIMPPPADAYISVGAKDSAVVTVNLLKGYAITKPSKYTVTYQGGNISGLMVKESTSFELR